MIEEIANLIADRALSGPIIAAGNGGSAAVANHLVCDLASLGIWAVSLCSDISNITRIANDQGYEHVFESQLRNIINPHCVIAFSVSGESRNIKRLIETADELGVRRYLFRGKTGGLTMEDFEEMELSFHQHVVQLVRETRRLLDGRGVTASWV